MSKAYLWTDGRGVIALYPVTASAAQRRPHQAAAVSGNGHSLSGRGQ